MKPSTAKQGRVMQCKEKQSRGKQSKALPEKACQRVETPAPFQWRRVDLAAEEKARNGVYEKRRKADRRCSVPDGRSPHLLRLPGLRYPPVVSRSTRVPRPQRLAVGCGSVVPPALSSPVCCRPVPPPPPGSPPCGVRRRDAPTLARSPAHPERPARPAWKERHRHRHCRRLGGIAGRCQTRIEHSTGAGSRDPRLSLF